MAKYPFLQCAKIDFCVRLHMFKRNLCGVSRGLKAEAS